MGRLDCRYPRTRPVTPGSASSGDDRSPPRSRGRAPPTAGPTEQPPRRAEQRTPEPGDGRHPPHPCTRTRTAGPAGRPPPHPRRAADTSLAERRAPEPGDGRHPPHPCTRTRTAGPAGRPPPHPRRAADTSLAEQRAPAPRARRDGRRTPGGPQPPSTRIRTWHRRSGSRSFGSPPQPPVRSRRGPAAGRLPSGAHVTRRDDGRLPGRGPSGRLAVAAQAFRHLVQLGRGQQGRGVAGD